MEIKNPKKISFFAIIKKTILSAWHLIGAPEFINIMPWK